MINVEAHAAHRRCYNTAIVKTHAPHVVESSVSRAFYLFYEYTKYQFRTNSNEMVQLQDRTFQENLSSRHNSACCFGAIVHTKINLVCMFVHTKQVDTVYFKNPRMHEMDDGIGDIQAQITDKQVLVVPERSARRLSQTTRPQGKESLRLSSGRQAR